jgi:hypothetical protein
MIIATARRIDLSGADVSRSTLAIGEHALCHAKKPPPFRIVLRNLGSNALKV